MRPGVRFRRHVAIVTRVQSRRRLVVLTARTRLRERVPSVERVSPVKLETVVALLNDDDARFGTRVVDEDVVSKPREETIELRGSRLRLVLAKRDEDDETTTRGRLGHAVEVWGHFLVSRRFGDTFWPHNVLVFDFNSFASNSLYATLPMSNTLSAMYR